MLRRSLAVICLIVAFASTSFASTNSNNATIALNANVASSITINPITGVNFGTVAAGSTYTGSTVVQMYWTLSPSQTLKLYAYFTTPAQALTDGNATPSNIPSSSVLLRSADAGSNVTSFTAVTGTTVFGPAGGSLLVKTVNITGANKVVSSTTPDTTNLDIQLDLTSLSLAAGSYTGTLNIQAQATP
jgi:hypothetical protein